MCTQGVCVRHPTDAPTMCLPIVSGSGSLTAPRLPGPLALDGDLGDWPTCFVTLDTTTAIVRDLGAGGRFPTGRFSVAHDATHVYIAVEVLGVLPLGDQPIPAIYQNNSISIYLDADGVFATARYDLDAAQIVVDHANRVQGFRSSALATVPNLTSGAAMDQATFRIEVAVQASTFGRAAFANTIGFDIGFEGGDGAKQTSELVWFEKCGPPACGCMNGMSAPFCDARQFGTLTLAP
jgi:Carbohydrate family 9 binding domain-like